MYKIDYANYSDELKWTFDIWASTRENVSSDMCSNEDISTRASVSAFRTLWSLNIQTASSEDSDQTVQIQWAHMVDSTFSDKLSLQSVNVAVWKHILAKLEMVVIRTWLLLHSDL